MTAQRLVRRFARETNLLVSGRDFSVVGSDAVAEALRQLLPALGAHLGDGGVTFVTGEAPEILLDGHPLPARKTAEDRVDAAGRHMPVSSDLARRLGEKGTVCGVRIGIAMVLEPKTAQLALLLRDAGATVAVYAHPDEIDVEVAAVLRARGVPVDGDPTLSGAAERTAAVSFLRRGFDLLLDDGSHLIRLAHEEGIATELQGAAEETTSGLTPLRLMQREGVLEIPVIAVNDALTKTSFDNRYGTGQSCVSRSPMRWMPRASTSATSPRSWSATAPSARASPRTCGRSASRSRSPRPTPVRALRAAHDGHRIGRLHDLAPGALVVSATGAPHTVAAEVLRTAAVVAVAGGVPHEIDLDPSTLRPYAGENGEASPFVERAGDGALVIARGGCVNLSAGEGNPIEIMDLSFAVQLFAVEHLLTHDLPAGVHPLPPKADTTIGTAALAARGEHIDERSPAQVDALREWRSPRFRGAPA